ncbi:MAG: T9SS C-terminal target domain-containing protein, partial [Ignavibacteriales bacterium]
NEVKSMGRYEVEFGNNRLASGVYFYRLQAGNYIQTKKMMMIK